MKLYVIQTNRDGTQRLDDYAWPDTEAQLFANIGAAINAPDVVRIEIVTARG